MTESAYKAKEWLNRTIDLYDKAEKTAREIKLIESRINKAVMNYESAGSGSADPIVRQQQHEDALLEYSEKMAKYDKEYLAFVRQEFITIYVLDSMKNRRAANILFMRHISRYSIKEIAKDGTINLKESQLYNLYKSALEELAPLLITEEPKAIKEVEEQIRERQTQATA